MAVLEKIYTGEIREIKKPVKKLKEAEIDLPRISIISSERYPHHDTNTQQVVKNANAFHKAGIPVELVLPKQIEGIFKKGFDLKKKVYDYYNIPNGLEIKELKNVPACKLRLEKFFHSFFATINAVWNKKVDIIYTRNKVTALLALLFNKNFIFETYRRLGDEFPRIMKYLASASKDSNFIGMVLHSQVAADSMGKVGFSKENLFVLHNGYDSCDMQPILSKKQARIRLGLSPSKRYIVYTGNMQKNKCIESLIDIASLLPKEIFLLVGGREEDIIRLENYTNEKRGPGNVIFTGRQPIAIVSEYLYAADILIIPPVAAPLHKFGRTVLPFKIFPYLAAGRPIVAPDLPDMRELLKHNENAVLLEPDNPAQNAYMIGELIPDLHLQEKLAANAVTLAKSLTWNERAKKFKTWLGEKWSKRELRIEN